MTRRHDKGRVVVGYCQKISQQNGWDCNEKFRRSLWEAALAPKLGVVVVGSLKVRFSLRLPLFAKLAFSVAQPGARPTHAK